MNDSFMDIALCEAVKASARGDFPVGAVLALNGKLLSKYSNCTKNYDDPWVHVESYLIGGSILGLRTARQNKNNLVELYTTLEPCLDCLSFAARNGVKKVIYACPHPYQGDASLDTSHLSAFLQERWPDIEQGPYSDESYDLLTAFMRENISSSSLLEYFKEMRP